MFLSYSITIKASLSSNKNHFSILNLMQQKVSSASWYIINLFGLRSMYTLVLGADNAADQTKMMQDQMSGAALSMPDDLNKAFKVILLFICLFI
jgi:hypothetical protein